MLESFEFPMILKLVKDEPTEEDVRELLARLKKRLKGSNKDDDVIPAQHPEPKISIFLGSFAKSY